jgi:predicted AAA+ superfamily ATPase
MAQAAHVNDLISGSLPDQSFNNLRGLNPQWENKPGPLLPSYKRWVFDRLYRNLRRGLTPAVVLRGPRRVGKTVLLRQVIETLLKDGIPANRILYVPFDEIGSLTRIQEPVLAISRWFEERILGLTFNQAAREGHPAFLLFDEVQNLIEWAPQIKHLVDNHSVHALVTGSSSLRIEAGRDSLAGRITTLDLGPLLLREIAELRGLGQTRPIWDEASVR